jgi:hypothetical protein
MTVIRQAGDKTASTGQPRAARRPDGSLADRSPKRHCLKHEAESMFQMQLFLVLPLSVYHLSSSSCPTRPDT